MSANGRWAGVIRKRGSSYVELNSRQTGVPERWQMADDGERLYEASEIARCFISIEKAYSKEYNAAIRNM